MVDQKIMLWFCILYLFVMPVSALEDNFDDGEIASDWTLSGTWNLNAGGMPSATSNYSVSTTTTPSQSYSLTQSTAIFTPNYVSFWVKHTSNTDGGSALVDFSDSQNVQISADNQIEINQDSGQTNVGGIGNNVWYRIELTRSGTNFIVNIYDSSDALASSQTIAADVDDTSFIRLRAHQSASGGSITTHFDDVKVLFVPSTTQSSIEWDHDPYYTGDTAILTSNIVNFDDTTYSYYLDLYSTYEYLTTYEITSATEFNYYTFPLDWTDTSLLAKLVRVTDPYATNEVQLAYDISHFETLDWDTTVSFNKSSYNPSETLKVTWSGAADGSDVWLRAGDDGEVLESDVAYSGSFTFNVPANTTETYYIVDVITGGYSQVQASCVISSIPDFYFNYSVAVDQDEYVHGDWVTVTYSTDTPAVIKVFDDTNADIWHYLDVPAAVTNETWIYYIGDTDPFGSYSVLFGNNDFLVSDYYSVVSSTSFVQVVPESMYMYETMTIWYITNGSSTLSITDSSDSILFNQTVNSSSLESISYVPTVTGELTITLSNVPADATDSIIVYWAADPDDVPDDDDVIEDDVIEDVLEDDESMTEYFEGKFREFAPTAWGIFLLSIILWLMAILTSFGGSSKRR